jgi:Ca2+-binding RTX toxin-like protein
LYGLAGADTIFGGDDDDALYGGADNDKLYGENGADRLIGGAGADLLNGGNSFDTAMYIGSTGVTANLTTASLNTGDALGDIYVSIENLTGSLFADVLTGNVGANIVSGLGGDDFLFGLAGADKLDGGLGNDALEGGADGDVLMGGDGFDFAIYTHATAGVTASLRTQLLIQGTGDALGDSFNSIEGLSGSKFSDHLFAADTIGTTLIGDAGDDTLTGVNGNDILEGGVGRDTLIGGDGFDSATYGLAAAAITANLANSALNTGEALGDTYNSIEGLGGSNFSDKLTGNAIGNIINGGLGNDTLAGGAGADAFVFSTFLNSTANVDTITDFNVVDDIIWLENTGIFAQLTAPGVLAVDNFIIGTAAADSDDFVVYNKTTGDIFYDADGNGTGAAVKFAHVTANTALTVNDFLVI